MPITKGQGKKDGKQQYRVRINYTDSSGKAHQVERTAYGSAEAKLLETQLLQEYKDKQQTTEKLTLKQLYDKYMIYHAQETRATSHDKAKRTLELYVLPYFEKTRLDRLSQAKLAEWKTIIAAQELSISTKKYIYSHFVAFLNYAVKLDYLPRNPLSVLGTFKDTENFETSKDKLHYYTAEQFKKYIKIAYDTAETVTDWGYYVFFCIAFYTGARKGEINALKWSDVDGNIMHIRRSVAQKIKGIDIIETPPKNRSSYRDLQMPLPLIKILGAHKARQAAASKDFSDDYRVCGGIKCLRDTSIENKNTLFAKSADLPHIRIHDFRHTHASLLVNEGINIQEIARRLGHSKIEMTWNTYSHLYPREEERAVNILNKFGDFSG